MTTPTFPTAFPTAHVTDFGKRSQEAAVTAAQAATHALRTYAEAVAPQGSQPVDPQRVTTATFDLAERLLTAQRDYVTSTVALLTEAGEAVTTQASAAGETFKTQAEQATERVVDLATETTRRATTAGRNGVSV